MASVTSIVWGNTPKRISQPYGNTGYRPDWYQYSKLYGHEAGVHIGTDVSMECGTKIYAANDGTVKQSGFNNSFRPYPIHLIVDGTGIEEIYGHLQQGFVSRNQRVKKGQLIGLSGQQTHRGTTTPDGSGCHIHFEVRKPDSGLASGWRAINSTAYLGGAAGDVDDGKRGYWGEDKVDTAKAIYNFDPTETIAEIGGNLVEFGKRSFLVFIGLSALAIGLTSLLSGGGIARSAKNTGKAVVMLSPVGRAATIARASTNVAAATQGKNSIKAVTGAAKRKAEKEVRGVT